MSYALARNNAFTTSRVHQIRYRFQRGNMEEVLGELTRCQYRGAIVGNEGSGKTTLAEDLSKVLRARGHKTTYSVLTRASTLADYDALLSLCATLAEQDILILDGSEQLGAIRWHRLLQSTRRIRGLIVTSHRKGRLPTIFCCSTSARLFTDIVATLVPQHQYASRYLEDLYDSHQGNIRTALRALYDDQASIL